MTRTITSTVLPGAGIVATLIGRTLSDKSEVFDVQMRYPHLSGRDITLDLTAMDEGKALEQYDALVKTITSITP